MHALSTEASGEQDTYAVRLFQDDSILWPSTPEAVSLKSSSTTSLNRGGATARATTKSLESPKRPAQRVLEDDVRPRPVEQDARSVNSAASAGAPIGLLAAIGTPYAKKPLFRSRKFKLICFILTPLVGIIFTVLLCFPILRAIAKHTLTTAVMHIRTSNITSPTNTSFGLSLDGQVKKLGIFPAQVHFLQPVEVYWMNPDNMHEVRLGEFPLARLGAAWGHAKLNQISHFTIGDEDGFGRFSEHLITQTAFTWRLRSRVDASAFGFLPARNLDFVKDVTLPGVANLTNARISDFQLPGNDPAGGVTMDTVAEFTNPSSFGIETGTLAVELYYKGMLLGPAKNSIPFNLTSGRNVVPLSGRILEQTGNQTALDLLSELFSTFMNGDASPVVAVGSYIELTDGTRPGWLNRAVQKLQLHLPFQSPSGPLSPIKSITVGSFALSFPSDPAESYAPLASSNSTSASFGLPFGIDMDITSVAVHMALAVNRTLIANISTPYSDAQTQTLTQNAGYETGTMDITIPPSALIIDNTTDAQLAFDQFAFDLVHGNGSSMYLIGQTDVIASCAIGQIALTGVNFAVPAGLIGLSGLQTQPTQALSVDVVGGTSEALILDIEVGLTNPSNLIMAVGDVMLQMHDFDDGSYLGRVVLPDLHLGIGYQTSVAKVYYQANANPTALGILSKFTSGIDSRVSISGFNGSTPLESLTQAFMDLHLRTTLKGLGTQLLAHANLTALPTMGVANNTANALIALSNPFSSALRITNIQSNITSRGLFIGAVDQNTDFSAPGNQTSASPVLAAGLNLYPPVMFSLLRQLVVESGMDPAPLDGVVQLGGYRYMPTTASSSASQLSSHKRDLVRRLDASVYSGFELPTYVLQAFKSLTVDVSLVSVVQIGDFVTDLTYDQENVPAYTDSSLLLLLPILARPIVQKIIDGADLAFDSILLKDPQPSSLVTHLVGSITKAGPFAATMTAAGGLTVFWNGAPLGQITLPPLELAGDVGATLDLEAQMQIADIGHLTNFTRYLLTEPSFTWTVEAQNLSVAAMGVVVDAVSLTKTIDLAGFNGLKNSVTITHFDLPANDPAGGITLMIDTTMANPSQVGVELSSMGFQTWFGTTNLGPAAAGSALTLAPKSTISLSLAGRLIPQSSESGLADLSALFNGFVHGIPATVLVAGDFAGPSNVQWLNEGIKALQIPVVFPAAASLQIMMSITIQQMTLMFTEATAWNPACSTTNTLASFQFPFAFPLDITSIAAKMTLVDQNTEFAVLDIPSGPSTTDVVARTLQLRFSNVPLAAVSGSAHSIYSNFIADTTSDDSKSFGVAGVADTVAVTAIGPLAINGISFSLPTAIAGLQGLNARPAFVFHGYPSYLQINVNAHIFNPSNITIGTGDVSFSLVFQSQPIGVAFIPDLVLVPGPNIVATQVRFQPEGSAQTAAGQLLLDNFVQGVVSATTISGNGDTTHIESLGLALSKIALNTDIPPIMQNLVSQATIILPEDIAKTGIAAASFVLANPFTASLNLLSVLATAIYPNGNFSIGEIDVKGLSPPITAPGHSAITSYPLPFRFDLDPRVIVRLLISQAAKNGVDLGPLAPLLASVAASASSTTNISTSVLTDQTDQGNAPQCVSGHQFDVFDAVLASMRNLSVTLQLETTLKIDDYQTALNFDQYNVPAITDRSALYLIGVVAPLIVQNIANAAEMTVSGVNITNVTDSGFTVAMQGSLVGIGPFDAYILLPDGLDVMFAGSKIANIRLPPMCAAADVGIPNMLMTGALAITDENAFTGFATYLLHNPSFDWLLSTNTLRLQTLGTQFDGVTFQKVISLKAFNGLSSTILNGFSPTGDAPDGGGIDFDVNAVISSPADVGIELGHAVFSASSMGQQIGIITADDLILAPDSSTNASFTGLLTPQSGSGIAVAGQLFSTFLQGSSQLLQATGISVTSPAQPNHPVSWLSAAFKTLTINATLPGQIFELISVLRLANMQIVVVDPSEAYSVPVSSTETDVVYKSPFPIRLQVLEAGVDTAIAFGGVDAAGISLPRRPVVSSGISTGQDAPLLVAFQNETLRSLNNQAFGDFFAAVTDTASVACALHGTADIIAQMSIGNIPLAGIQFNVSSSIAGIASFNHQAQISGNLSVVGSGGDGVGSFSEQFGADFIRITLSVIMNNPSNVSITTNQMSFAAMYEGVYVGRAMFASLALVPGPNTLAGELHYAPVDPTQSDLLTQYLQRPTFGSTELIPVSIKGDAQSTPYGSLLEGMEGVTADTALSGIGPRLAADVLVQADIATVLCKHTVSMQIKVQNVFDTAIFVVQVDALAAQPRGNNYASATSARISPTPLAVAPRSTSDWSPPIPNVQMMKDLMGTFPLLMNSGKVGVDVSMKLAVAIDQPDGYLIPDLVFNQNDVHYTVVVSMGGNVLPDNPLDALAQAPGGITGLLQAGAECFADGAALPTTLCNIGTALAPMFQPLCAGITGSGTNATPANGSSPLDPGGPLGGILGKRNGEERIFIPFPAELPDIRTLTTAPTARPTPPPPGRTPP